MPKEESKTDGETNYPLDLSNMMQSDEQAMKSLLGAGGSAEAQGPLSKKDKRMLKIQKQKELAAA